MAKFLPKAITAGKRFFSGALGVGKTPFKETLTSKAGLAGTASTLGAAFAYTPHTASKLSNVSKASNLKLPNIPSVKNFT